MRNRIRILATSDIHGTVYPYDYADKSAQNKGLSRMHTLISSLRDENTLLIDNGDTIEGSPLTFYHYEKHPDEVSPVTSVMHDMKYDYVNVGNHDFDYGEEALMMHLQNLNAPCITSNWIYHNKPYGPTYVIREIAGRKIAVFGITTQYIPHWETKGNIMHSHFQDAYQTAKRTLDVLKRLEKPDYIICVYHGGFETDPDTDMPSSCKTRENEGYYMLTQLKDIDVLIAGHQHRTYCGKKNGTVYTMTLPYAQELACIDIYPDTDEIIPRILKNDAEPDTDITKSADDEETQCQLWLDQPLGTTDIDLSITNETEARIHKSQLATFINMVEMDATGADIAISAIFSGVKGFKQEITMRELVSSYIYPNTLVVKKLTGKELKEYLEKNAYFFTCTNSGISISPEYDLPYPKYYNYDMADGISYTIKVSNERDHRIQDLLYHDQPVTDDMTFNVVMTNYRAGGGGNFDMLRKAPVVKEVNQSMVSLIAEYILKHKVINFKPVNNIRVMM